MKCEKPKKEYEDWVKYKERFIGQWKEKPDWCVNELKKYLGGNPSLIKLCFVGNYLTGSGFRTGAIPNTPNIKKFRAKVFTEYKKKKYEK